LSVIKGKEGEKVYILPGENLELYEKKCDKKYK
jgi:hypothetical protein